MAVGNKKWIEQAFKSKQEGLKASGNKKKNNTKESGQGIKIG